MEPQIQLLMEGVPVGFQPTLRPKEENDRLVGTLDDLDADTRRIVVAVLYFLEVGEKLNAAHKLEHEQPDFQGGEACERNAEGLVALQEKIVTLQWACGKELFATFTLEPGETIDFCAEGVVAAPPEPENPILALLRSLSAQGVTVIGAGPGGSIDVKPTSVESVPARRSLVGRLFGR